MALVLFGAAVLILRRLAGLFAGAARRSQGGRDQARERVGKATELVRDRVCNTFVPKDKALTLEESGQIHFFCSEQCRTRHIAGASREIGVAHRA